MTAPGRLAEELRWSSAVDVAGLVRAGELEPTASVAATIERIEHDDPYLAAVVIPLFERGEAPPTTGPAAGVATLLKDAGEELSGTPHWVGTRGLRGAGHRSDATTPLAAKIERLGFAIVGKSACPELSSDSTTEPAGFAPTRNPWALDRSAGGSSGGAAAAVAAGLVPVAHGADATGSLRFPAALCGIVTLKPSRGRIVATPAAGQHDPLRVWTQFALARDVRDLRWLFDLLVDDAATDGDGRPPAGLRVGFVDHDPILGLPVAPECADAVRSVGTHLEACGHHVEPGYPDAFGTLVRPFVRMSNVFGPWVRKSQVDWVSARLGRPCESGDLSDDVLEVAARAASLSAVDVDAAFTTAGRAMDDVLDFWWDHDLLVTPVTLEPAWRLGEPAPIRTGLFALPFSFSGQPVLVVPAGMTDDGRPVGVQVVGRPGDDELLLALGLALQESFAWLDRHPPALDAADR